MARNERNAPSVREGVTEIHREVLGVDLEIEVQDASEFFDKHFRQIGLVDVDEFNDKYPDVRISAHSQYV